MQAIFDSSIKKIHLIGIGGISMSAIAKILISKDYQVSGSDFQDSPTLAELRQLGVTVYDSHRAEQVTGSDLVIYTSAIGEDNPELQEARKQSIPVMARGKFLGHLTAQFQDSIAISGTHGKTTSTAMTSVMLHQSELSPVLLIGAHVESLGGNAVIGQGSTIVNEACEYHRSFLDFNYNIGVILNIDEDHLDYFKDLDDIKNAFVDFANHTRQDGIVILNKDDKNCMDIAPRIQRQKLYFSIREQADYWAKNIKFEKGYTEFDVYRQEEFYTHVRLALAGDHNILDAMAAIAATDNIQSVLPLIPALEQFKGASRRMESRGMLKGAILLEDYAHHPSEIKATLATLRQLYPDKKLLIVFQPHTYTRTLKLFQQFLGAFPLVDQLVLTEIYAAREKNIYNISSKDLCDALLEQGQAVKFIPELRDAAAWAESQLDDNTLFVAMGAGNIHNIFDYFSR